MKTTPAVTVTRALLPSEGLNERRATFHTYSHSEVATITRGREKITGLAHYFKCSETGELRRWGFDITFAKDDGSN